MNALGRALRRLRCEPQVANGTAQQTLPVPDGSAAAAVNAAWLPTRMGQAVPMLGEEVQPSWERSWTPPI